MRFHLACLLAGSTLALATSCSHAAAVESEAPLARLLAGNQRFVDGQLRYVQDVLDKRALLAKGQRPFAVIVGCADSRVAPEIVFDQGLGELFVVRVAGNVIGDADIGSIEYAVEHLGASLIVVLGHERCGAVKAVLDGGELHGHLSSFEPTIAPAVADAKAMDGDVLDNAVRANVARIVKRLVHCEPVLAENAYFEHVKIVGARYDLDTGVVEFFENGAKAGPRPGASSEHAQGSHDQH